MPVGDDDAVRFAAATPKVDIQCDRPRARRRRRTCSTQRRRRSTGSTSRRRRRRRLKQRTKAAGATEGDPKLLAIGGRDLLIVDAKNVVWRWRPADTKGNGTIRESRSRLAPGWGDDIIAIGTFLRDADQGLYNLYVVDPSEQKILAYTPAADGSGFPAGPQPAGRRPRRLEG